MLARVPMPAQFDQWNARWHAPSGRRSRLTRLLGDSSLGARARGPFAWQPNNSTRAFEYPWVYQQIRARGRGLQIAEVGGGVAGLQFVLASEGDHVVNIDPGLAARGKGWELSADAHRRLCRIFRAPVQLITGTIDTAPIPEHSLDVLVSVSALEHFAAEDLAAFAERAARLLKPNGVVILTVDLFLDLVPFSRKATNEYGRNVDIRKLLLDARLALVEGDPRELYGFPEFDPQRVLEQLPTYLIGAPYPALSQCLVAAPTRPA